MEDRLHHTIRALQVPGYAVQAGELTFSILKLYGRGVPGYAPEICHHLHSYLLPEPGRTSLTCCGGLIQHQLYLELEKCEFHSPPVRPLPGLHHRRHSDGTEESSSCQKPATTNFHQRTATFSRLCQLPLKIHSQFQSDCLTHYLITP